jgi:O-antigen/teichoic acid export membrane protein
VPVLASIPVVNAVYSRLDVLLLSAFRGFAEVGVYSAASRLVDVARVLPMSYSRAIYPVVSRLHTENGRELAQTFHQANRTLLLLMCTVALGLAAASSGLIELLYGPSFADAGSVLRVLAWSVVPFAIASLFAQVLFAANLAVLDLRVNIISIVLCAGLNVVAIPRWGALGAAAATLLSAVFYACMQYLYVTTRVTKPSLLGTFAKITSAAGLAWVVAAFTLWLAWPPAAVVAVALGGYSVGLLCSGSIGRQDLVSAYSLLASFGPRRA